MKDIIDNTFFQNVQYIHRRIKLSLAYIGSRTWKYRFSQGVKNGA